MFAKPILEENDFRWHEEEQTRRFMVPSRGSVTSKNSEGRGITPRVKTVWSSNSSDRLGKQNEGVFKHNLPKRMNTSKRGDSKWDKGYGNVTVDNYHIIYSK